MAIPKRSIGGVLLPQELVDEITARLPVKSIIRLESVCKGWHSQFRSTSFIKLHNRYHQQQQADDSEVVHKIKITDLFNMAPQLWNGTIPPTLPSYYYKSITLENPFFTLSQYRKVSVNGPLNNSVYCLTSIHASDLVTAKVALCNPSIHQSKFLPPFPPELISAEIGTCEIVSGFGTVTSSSDYSVVVVVNYSIDDEDFLSQFKKCFLVLLYTSESGCWERLVDYIPNKRTVGASKATQAFTGRKEIMDIRPPLEVCSQRFFKGCWYWTVNQREYYEEEDVSVLSFDFARQSFQLIKGPPNHLAETPTSFDYHGDVIVLHDHLTVIHTYYNEPEADVWICAEYDVWMMMDYGVEKSWTRIYNIHPNFEGNDFDRLCRIEYSVVDEEEEEEEEGRNGVRIERLCFQGPCERTLSSYDVHGGHEKFLGFSDEYSFSFSMGGISTYRETLERV